MTIGKGMRVDGTISLGHILTILSAILPGMWVAVSVANRADDTRSQLTEFKDGVKLQFAELRRENGEALQAIQRQIASFPTQAARLDQLERQVGELRQSLKDTAGQVTQLQQISIESREAIRRLDRDGNVPVRQTR